MNALSCRRLTLLAFGLSLSPLVCPAASSSRTQQGERTALDRYIAKPDTNYTFSFHSSVKSDGYTMHYLEMTSQSWLTTNEVNRPLWQHWLTIVVPDKITTPTALLFINGGSHRTNPPSKPDASLILGATAVGGVIADLRNVVGSPGTELEFAL